MVTDRTPPGKRIARAEKSATEWKMKAIERREEVERLNLKMNEIESRIAKFDDFKNKIHEQSQRIASLEHELHKSHLTIARLEKEVKEFKKKRPV